MTNEELIRQLKTASVQADDMRLRNFGYLMNTAAEKIDELLDLLSNLHTLTDMLKETVPQWISVDERLPKRSDDALFYIEWTGHSGTVYREIYMSALYDMPKDYKPLYWMPLPNPPHERKEE